MIRSDGLSPLAFPSSKLIPIDHISEMYFIREGYQAKLGKGKNTILCKEPVKFWCTILVPGYTRPI